MYFCSAEIGRYEKNYSVTLNLDPGWTPYPKLCVGKYIEYSYQDIYTVQ